MNPIKEDGIPLAKGNSSAILIFHGLTGSPFEMMYYARSLRKKGFDVFCPDLPGHCTDLNDLKSKKWRDWTTFAESEYDKIKSDYEKVYASGLCMGAVLCLYLSLTRTNIEGIALLSPTLMLDGWALPWHSFLLPFVYYTPAKYLYSFKESDPFGIKNTVTRKKVSSLLSSSGSAFDKIPGVSISELNSLSRYMRKYLKEINTPIILFHSEEDDFASIKNSELIFEKVSSQHKEFIRLKNSYHMITIDNEKNIVAEKTYEFFNSLATMG